MRKLPGRNAPIHLAATIFDRYFSAAFWLALKIYALSVLYAFAREAVHGERFASAVKWNLVRILPVMVACIIGFGVAVAFVDWRMWRSERARKQVGFFHASRDNVLDKASGLTVAGVGAFMVLVLAASISLMVD